MDYRGLNAKTHYDAYPMPLVHEIKGNICLIYINDVIVFSRAQEQYLCDLDAVFLGFLVDQAKVDAIIAYPVPTELKSL